LREKAEKWEKNPQYKKYAKHEVNIPEKLYYDTYQRLKSKYRHILLTLHYFYSSFY
jgi:hypothetical protein